MLLSFTHTVTVNSLFNLLMREPVQNSKEHLEKGRLGKENAGIRL